MLRDFFEEHFNWLVVAGCLLGIIVCIVVLAHYGATLDGGFVIGYGAGLASR